MYEKEQYYCRFRDTRQEDTLLRDIYVKISRFHDEVLTYDKLPKAARNDLKIEDILGVLYVSNPQPSPCTVYTYLGILENAFIQYQDNAIYQEGMDVIEKFEILTSFLVDSYAQDLWNYPKTEEIVIDGHEYEIIIILKNRKTITYHARLEYFKSFNTLMHLLGSYHRDEEVVDEDDEWCGKPY